MKKNNFIEGAFIATFAIVISKIIGALYVIPFYKIIGTQGGALYGYAYNIYNLFLTISTAGIPIAISKITSEYVTLKKDNEKKYMYDFATKIILIFSITSFIICFFGSNIIAKILIGNVSGGNTINDISYVIKAISFALLIVPTLGIYRGYLQGHKYISVSSLSQVIEQIIRIIIILLGSFIALKKFNLPLKIGIAISLLGAFIGALISYLYLKKKNDIVKNKDKNVLSYNDKKSIRKKIISYCIPFILINLINYLYNTTDMILIIRGLNNLNFLAKDIETISSIFTTWGNKLTSIITAVSTGLIISLIPHIVESNVKNDQEEVNKKFNQALQILLHVILPLSIFTSIFASQIWHIFYSENIYGPTIMKFTFLVTIFDCSFTVICTTLQGLNKYKLVIISVLSGLLANALLDLPLIYLFNNLGFPPYYGAIVATVIGYIISLSISLITLEKKYNFNFKEILYTLPRLIISLITLIIITLLLKNIFNYVTSKIIVICILIIIFIICLIIYYVINGKNINNLIEKKYIKYIDKLIKKRSK